MQEVGYAILFHLSYTFHMGFIDIRRQFEETVMRNESIFFLHCHLTGLLSASSVTINFCNCFIITVMPKVAFLHLFLFIQFSAI